MTSLSPHLAAANGTPPDDLFAHILSANPFTDNRVNGPAPAAADVGDIHRAAFERLTGLAREAHASRRGLGAVLWGEAGVGKSHVLARIERWATEASVPFVYLHNLQASPDGLPRSLLRAVVSTLTRGQGSRFHRTPLYRLAASFAHEAFDYEPEVKPSWPEIAGAWGRLMEREGARHAALVDHAAYIVLFRFFQSAHAAGERQHDGNALLAVRWLSGDYLDPAEAARLHLRPAADRDDPVGLADNQQIKQVLVALTRLARAARQPFVLAFDQVDNLDDAQMAALARFLEALLDSAANLLVVSAGVQATLVKWRQTGVIQESAWDRLAQFEVQLKRVSPAEAERIVIERLRQFFEPFPGAGELPPDPLFPLGPAWRAVALGDRTDLRPRDVINRAREGFRREREALQREGGPTWLQGWGRRRPVAPGSEPSPQEIEQAIDQQVARQLAEHQSQRGQQPGALPPDADNLAGLVGGLLDQCRALGVEHGVLAVERPPARAGARPAYELLLRRSGATGEDRTGLLFVVTTNGQSTTASLRRVVEAPDPLNRLFLITDERRPLIRGAKGDEYLARLGQGCAGQFHAVELTSADVAELDALRAIPGLARSGDLEVEIAPGLSRPLSEAEVIESLHRQGRYRTAPLLRHLLGEIVPAPVATP